MAWFCQNPHEINAWLGVMKRRRGTGEHRSCIFCGDRSGSARKTIDTATVLEMINKNHNVCINSPMHTTITNICNAVESVSGDDSLATCLCCLHWCNRQKRVESTPMMLLKWHFRTLVALNHKRFDKRVLRRLCAMLCDPHNFYRPFFTAAELETAARVHQSHASQIGSILADLYASQNANPIFVNSSEVAEYLRK